jgi:hypothetical protein
MEELGVREGIILKQDLRTSDGMVWTSFMWHRIRICRGAPVSMVMNRRVSQRGIIRTDISFWLMVLVAVLSFFKCLIM